jgi:hypothetical protein
MPVCGRTARSGVDATLLAICSNALRRGADYCHLKVQNEAVHVSATRFEHLSVLKLWNILGNLTGAPGLLMREGWTVR